MLLTSKPAKTLGTIKYPIRSVLLVLTCDESDRLKITFTRYLRLEGDCFYAE